MGRNLDQQVIDWAADVMGARIASIQGLRAGSNPWRLQIDRNSESSTVVLRVGDVGIATEVAALRVANDHGLPAPLLLGADVEDSRAGIPAVLSTAMNGSSKIPASPTQDRLRMMGAMTAAISNVQLAPTPELPLRQRPISSVDFDADRRRSASSSVPLMTAAVERLASVPEPEVRHVFVHGDFWQGNTLWIDETLVGLLDWDMAGVGNAGLDLGSARLDAAIMFGQDYVAEVLIGWEQASGEAAENVAYWDVVAALSTPADMDLWRSQIHSQGRADLASTTMTDRRDSFLRAALGQL